MKHRWLIFLCFLFVSAVIGVIWWHSMQNGVASHAESRRMLAFALSHLQGTRLASYLSDIMGPLSRPRSKILRVAVSRIILSSEASKVKLVGNLVA